jgi:hypothetical protein
MNQNNSRIEGIVEEFGNRFLKRKYETTMDADEFEDLIETQKDRLRTTLHQELQKARHDWLREEIVSFRQEMENYPMVNEPEWRRGYIEALQDQIDRYQSGLDQSNK